VVVNTFHDLGTFGMFFQFLARVVFTALASVHELL
jgi:hypothetical protein